MFYYDEVVVLPGGLRVSAKLLQPIGIHDASVAWGIAVPDFRSRAASDVHLLISPIHPDSWAFLFRLRVAMRHSKGALGELAKILADAGGNIYFSQAGHAGHHHATWNVIGEAIPVKSALAAKRAELINSRRDNEDDRDATLEFCNELARRMFRFLSQLEKKIKDRHLEAGGAEYERELYKLEEVQSELRRRRTSKITYAPLVPVSHVRDVGVLHHRMAMGWSLLYDLSSMPSRGAIQRGARQHLTSAVSCRWLTNLAFFSVYGNLGIPPIRFEYEARSRLLKVVDNAPSFGALAGEAGPSRMGVAAFDDAEHYLRLKFVHPEQTERVDSIEVTYRATYSPHEQGEPPSSRGTIGRVCELLKEFEINLLSASNWITRLDEQGEEGTLFFIGESGERKAVRERREALRRELQEIHHEVPSSGTVVKVIDASVRPFRSKRIFVSRPFHYDDTEGKKGDEIFLTFKAAADAEGWEAVEASTVIGNIRSKIEREMRTCEAFIQLAYLREDDDRNDARFSYLNFEYGMAIGMMLPSVRMVDAGVKDKGFWRDRLRADSGVEQVEFNYDASRPERLKSLFARTLRKLEDEMARGESEA